MTKREVIFSKRGQATIFIIIAVVIVAVIALVLILRGSFSTVSIPASLQPAYANFLECVEQDALTGASVLGSQGGYIELPEFEAGSRHSPFSSQLNFLGNPIPYWYYISGNNLEKSQVPSVPGMEDQLESFVESRVRDCEFQAFVDQGIEIDMGEPEADVDIQAEKIIINLEMDLSIAGGNETAFVQSHKTEASSRLGELYQSALEVYNQEQEEMFLEEYALDNLRLYAPVDGFEISCSPLVWNADEVFNNLQDATEVNTMALNSHESDEYYDLDLPAVSNHEIRFLNSKDWPSAFEVNPSEANFLVAEPVGNQPGLGILGFCYASYHFVYDVKYPVLVQVYHEENPEEVFQFPIAVVIDNNQARQTQGVEAVAQPEIPLCDYKNTPVNVRVRDTSFRPVEAQVSYECLSQKCNMGIAENGFLSEEFPQCANGYVHVQAEGYESARYLFSSVSGGSLEVFVDPIHSVPLSLIAEGQGFNGKAIITFLPQGSTSSTKAVIWPEQASVELSEGTYDVEVQAYEESEITLGAVTAEQCIEVSRGAFLGSLVFTQERCFEIEVPEQKVSEVLIGGGKAEWYASESDLQGQKIIEINIERFPVPGTVEELQVNYGLYDSSQAEINVI